MFLVACGTDEPADTAATDTPLDITIADATPAPSADADAASTAETAGSESPDAETEVTSDEVSADDASEAPEALLVGGAVAAADERSYWTGSIDGRIGFTMWLSQEGDLARGELVYDTVGEPIAVHGRAYPSGDAWLLREFGADGRVSGTMILGSVVDGVVTDATWGDLSLDLNLARVEDAPSAFAPAPAVAGTYSYAYEPFDGEDCCGPTGSLRITDVGEDSIRFGIEAVTGGPGFSLAIIDPITVPFDGSTARYEQVGDGVDCAFDLRIFDGVVHVNHVDDRFQCLFGNAAGVEGIYVLTQSFLPAAESAFHDAVLTSDAFGGVSLGDTWADLTARLGAPAFDPATADEISEGCNYLQIPNDPLSPWFMMLGDGEDSVVSRIELVRDDQRTEAGVGVGSTIDEVLAAYPDGVTNEPHAYIGPEGRYLAVTSLDDPDSTILFETDMDGRVQAVRNGFSDPIRWIEGCA